MLECLYMPWHICLCLCAWERVRAHFFGRMVNGKVFHLEKFYFIQRNIFHVQRNFISCRENFSKWSKIFHPERYFTSREILSILSKIFHPEIKFPSGEIFFLNGIPVTCPRGHLLRLEKRGGRCRIGLVTAQTALFLM